jgi:hypothetical protein
MRNTSITLAAQAPLDGALDVAECVGRIAVATPTKRLIEEGQLVGVALEKDTIEPVLIIVRNMPERIAEPLVKRFAEGRPWKFLSDELHQSVREYCPRRCSIALR